jgi:cell division septum initiation protein DivIVA
MPYSTAEHDFYQKRYTKILKEGMDFESERNTFSRKLFKVQMTTDKSVRDTSISSVQNLRRLAENQQAPLVRINQGFISEIAWNRFGLALETSFESEKTDDNNAIEKEASNQAARILRTEDNYAGRVFRRAMDPSYAIADGAPLISASHVLRTGGTQSNTLTSQLALSYSSLGQATDVMMQLKDNSGNTANHGNKFTIMVPNEFTVRETAFQLAGVNAPDYKPGTNNNDANYFTLVEGLNYDVLVVNALNLSRAQEIGETTIRYTDGAAAEYTNRWFLLDRELLAQQEALVMPVLKEGDSLIRQLETESLAMKRIVYHFFGHGVRAGLHNWVVGSKGDGSASNF